MNKKEVLTILLISFLISCIGRNKSEEKKAEDKLSESLVRKVINKKDIKNNFSVILNVLAKNNDNFQLFYTEDYMLSFNEEQSITAGFLGAENYQNIIFQLPENVFPDRYRIDVGSNKEQKSIKIKSLIFRYGDKEIFIPSDLLSKMMVPNKNIEYNSFDNTYNLIALNIDGTVLYDPYFTCSPELVRLLLEL